MATLAGGHATTMAVVVAFTIISSFPAAVVADLNFIRWVCSNADPDTNGTCVEVLSTDPRSFNTTKFEDLASIGLDIATSTRNEVANGIDAEATKHDERSPLGLALVDCANYYSYAVDPLENARESFNNGAILASANYVDEAGSASNKCEQAFSDRELTSVVAELDRRMRQRCDVAYNLIDLLYKT
jgi:pectinesterase inhibitor-like protein